MKPTTGNRRVFVASLLLSLIGLSFGSHHTVGAAEPDAVFLGTDEQVEILPAALVGPMALQGAMKVTSFAIRKLLGTGARFHDDLHSSASLRERQLQQAMSQASDTLVEVAEAIEKNQAELLPKEAEEDVEKIQNVVAKALASVDGQDSGSLLARLCKPPGKDKPPLMSELAKTAASFIENPKAFADKSAALVMMRVGKQWKEKRGVADLEAGQLPSPEPLVTCGSDVELQEEEAGEEPDMVSLFVDAFQQRNPSLFIQGGRQKIEKKREEIERQLRSVMELRLGEVKSIVAQQLDKEIASATQALRDAVVNAVGDSDLVKEQLDAALESVTDQVRLSKKPGAAAAADTKTLSDLANDAPDPSKLLSEVQEKAQRYLQEETETQTGRFAAALAADELARRENEAAKKAALGTVGSMEEEAQDLQNQVREIIGAGKSPQERALMAANMVMSGGAKALVKDLADGLLMGVKSVGVEDINANVAGQVVAQSALSPLLPLATGLREAAAVFEVWKNLKSTKAETNAARMVVMNTLQESHDTYLIGVCSSLRDLFQQLELALPTQPGMRGVIGAHRTRSKGRGLSDGRIVGQVHWSNTIKSKIEWAWRKFCVPLAERTQALSQKVNGKEAGDYSGIVAVAIAEGNEDKPPSSVETGDGEWRLVGDVDDAGLNGNLNNNDKGWLSKSIGLLSQFSLSKKEKQAAKNNKHDAGNHGRFAYFLTKDRVKGTAIPAVPVSDIELGYGTSNDARSKGAKDVEQGKGVFRQSVDDLRKQGFLDAHVLDLSTKRITSSSSKTAVRINAERGDKGVYLLTSSHRAPLRVGELVITRGEESTPSETCELTSKQQGLVPTGNKCIYMRVTGMATNHEEGEEDSVKAPYLWKLPMFNVKCPEHTWAGVPTPDGPYHGKPVSWCTTPGGNKYENAKEYSGNYAYYARQLHFLVQGKESQMETLEGLDEQASMSEKMEYLFTEYMVNPNDHASGSSTGPGMSVLSALCLNPKATAVHIRLAIRFGATTNARDGLKDGRPSQTPLMRCVSQGDAAVDKVEALLLNGADVSDVDHSGKSVVDFVPAEGAAKVRQLLEQAEQQCQLFVVAAGSAKVADVEEALRRDDAMLAVDCQHKGQSALLAVASSTAASSAQVAALLLKHGARVDEGDVNGASPLILASASGNDAVVSILLASFANLDLQDDEGDTALLKAIAHCHVSTVRLLQDAGALAFLHNKKGQSATDVSIDADCSASDRRELRELFKVPGHRAATPAAKEEEEEEEEEETRNKEEDRKDREESEKEVSKKKKKKANKRRGVQKRVPEEQ